jgi:steroid delta-isomerase-like uncharacterized protein
MKSEHQALLQRHLAAENAHRMADTLATLHPDCVFEDVATGQIFRGRTGAEAYYRQWWDAFAVTVSREEGQRYWAENGAYIAEARYRGVHGGSFLGIAPTGRPIDFRFVVIVTFRDGLMAGETFYYDLAGLLRQIGVTDASRVKVA